MHAEFHRHLALIDRRPLVDFLKSLSEPCFENELLQCVFPTVNILNIPALELYQKHFLLFHILYQLQEDFFSRGMYLHVHFMRTFLVPYPQAGFCRHYDPEPGKFCGEPAHEGYSLCPLHRKLTGDEAIEELSHRYFYRDEKNFFRLDRDSAESFINGTWEVLSHYDEFKTSFRLLDLTETSDLELIKKAFQTKAKQFHPDLQQGTHEAFCEINRAYRFLMKVIPRFSKKRA